MNQENNLARSMTLEEKIDLLARLGTVLIDQEQDQVQMIIHKAVYHNKWFTPESVGESLQAIANQMLNADKLIDFTSSYKVQDDQRKRVGMVLAGNIPAVGWHDILCTFLSGNVSVFKCSEKDSVIIPFFTDWLSRQDPNASVYFEQVDKLVDMDAVIATGSNNSARYFESYFGKYPHIIRKNRNAVAVLDGTETDQELQELGADIFTHFGLGCRNVSKVYLPKGYDIECLSEALHTYNKIILHPKYKNNYDYNIAFYMLNRRTYHNNGAVILLEDNAIASRIATVHYEYYESLENLAQDLVRDREQIQCVVSKIELDNVVTVPLGNAQKPSLSDFADGVDTMTFLTNL